MCQAKSYFLILFLLALTAQAQNTISTHSPSKFKIAFGSCNKFYRNHKSIIFDDIAAQNPDVWVWLGDVSYNDNMILPAIWLPEANPEANHAKLAATKQDPSYQNMLKKVNAEIGVWDDHDYGLNNSGQDFSKKDQMRQVWLDFFNEPLESERRHRKGGIYASYYLGESKRAKIILTDVRWNRQKEDILGEDQWIWLEKELSDKAVELFILGTGSQFLPDDRFIPETWDIKSKNRFYEIVKRTNASVVIISGDVHFAEIMEHPCSLKKIGYRLVEVTSSGLSFDINQFGDNTFEFGSNFVFTPTYNNKSDRFVGKNYGIVEIEWNDAHIEQSKISVQVFTLGQTTPVLERKLVLQEVRQSQNNTNNQSACIVDDIPAYERWKTFALNSLSRVLSTFDTQVIFMFSTSLLQIIAVILFYGYLVKCIIKALSAKQKQD